MRRPGRRRRVEGHTVLGRGEFKDFAPLVRLAAKHATTPAVVLLRWAHQLGAGLVFSSRQDERVREVLTGVPQLVLSDDDVAEITGFYPQHTHRFYPQHTVRSSPCASSGRPEPLPDDIAGYIEVVVKRLRDDLRARHAGLPVSRTALDLPTQTTRQILADPVAQRIAARLFPPGPGKPPHSSFDRYRALIRVLRRTHSARSVDSEPPSSRHIGDQTVADVLASPSAMPVCVAPREELDPFFSFLRGRAAEGSGVEASAHTFVRGTYFADGRMDLCKQGVGPDHIAELCTAVAEDRSAQKHEVRKHQVRHFLLGNNIACAGPSAAGAESLAALMANSDLAIETWYLAGNAIGPRDIEIIAGSLAGNDVARSLWLKRNPLGKAGAAHLGTLLANSRLELLDLHNTALFDEGVEALALAVGSAMNESTNEAPLRLRHLYLSANGLTAKSIRALGTILQEGIPLESLYLSMNRLRHEGLNEVVALVNTGYLRKLRRLDLGSIGLERPALTPLALALIRECPQLKFLDLGTYKSTRAMGERANVLSDVDALRRLLVEHPSLQVLDVSLCGLAESHIDALIGELRPNQSLEGVGNQALHHSHDERRRIKQPASVVHIDSIYRGRA